MTSSVMSSKISFTSKMEFTLQQKAEVVKLYYQFKSPAIVINEMMKQYPNCGKLEIHHVKRIVKWFENSGTVSDGRHFNTGRPKTGRSKEMIDKVQSIINETPSKSIRTVFRELNGNETSVSSVYRVLRFDLHLTPYKIAVMQHLKDTDIASRIEFCRWMLQQNDNVVNNMWFTD